MTSQLERLGRRLAELQEDFNRLARSNNLSHSSFDGGAIIQNSDDGTVGSVFGTNYDGTNGVVPLTSPAPPTPNILDSEVTSVVGGIRVRWGGTWVGGPTVVAPLGFSSVEVHVADNPNFTALLFDTFKPNIMSPRGGEVVLSLPPGTYWVRLICRTTAGRVGAPSDALGPVDAKAIAKEDLGFSLASLGGNRIFRGPVEPVGTTDTPLLYGDLWLKTPDNVAYQFQPPDPGSWIIVQDQNIVQALNDAAVAAGIAGSKARIYYQTSAPTGLTSTNIGDEWVDTDDKFVTYTWSGTVWVKNAISTSSFEPGSLVVSTVAATGSVTAALLESILVLATTIIAGQSGVNGPHAKLSAGGLETFDVDPDGGLMATGGFGTGSDGLYFVDPTTKVAMATLDRTGALAVREASISGTDGDGDGEIDGGFNVYGREFSDWVDEKAEGTIASGFYGNAANGLFASGITTRFGLGEISFDQGSGRQYMVIFTGLHVASTVGGDRALYSVRFTEDGSTPTISNGKVLGSSIAHCAVADQAFSAPPIIGMGSFVPGSRVRLLVTLERLSGTGTLSALTYTSTDAYAAPFRFFSADMGLDIPDTYINNDGGGVRSGGNPSPVGKQTYTSTWAPSFIGSYLGNGSRRTDTPDMVQGFTSYYTAGGTQKALAGFTGGAIAGETGKSITTALSGATVKSVQLFLYDYHSNLNSGGTASIGYHGNATLPATAPNATYGGYSNAYFTKGSGRWFTLPSSTFANWASGTYRGITVGPTGDYMRFYGGGSLGPRLKITYTR